jgi:hypothetical protein
VAHVSHLEANRPEQVAINATGEDRGGRCAIFVFLALPLCSSSSLELLVAPAEFLHRLPGELRRAAASTFLRRSAAATSSIRRHGAACVYGTIYAAAVAAVALFFLAFSSFLVLFVFLLVDGPTKWFLEGFVHAGG